MSNRRKGPVMRAAIHLLAEEKRIPIPAAAQKYACMSIDKKQALCIRAARLLDRKANP